MKFGTKAIHAGVEPDPSTGAIMTPIYQTSTYVQEGPAQHKGYASARGANPTRNALQKSLAALENGNHALCFSSGMGATDAEGQPLIAVRTHNGYGSPNTHVRLALQQS